MRRRHLMCESRVLPCPQGSAEWQKGETREEGGHVLDMFALTNITGEANTTKKALPSECFFIYCNFNCN